ncbi:uncharacterized protein LOC110823281 [Carica papaya]|uniref:uncharacterized protein LOC110823281 n=1 Tax=Carica papaya TaxID=3649 RepID=UPI000B8CBAC0|nr:uncharacterized protein LOC110823281 [Carica papaya]
MAANVEEDRNVSRRSEDIDELRQKLEYTTFQLESVKKKADEEAIRHNEQLRHLFSLVNITCKERDEARHQLQKLLNKFMSSADPTDLVNPILPHVQPAKANSSITESNSLSHSPGFSPVDSLFDNINMADSGFVNQPNNLCFVSKSMTKTEPCGVAMDNASKGRPLPEKGKLLQAVMDAGPLLQTLLDAGPLPKWKNPPPPRICKIPPVPSKKKCRPAIVKPLNSLSCMESQISSPSTLKLSNGMNVSGPSNSIRILADKRQKVFGRMNQSFSF